MVQLKGLRRRKKACQYQKSYERVELHSKFRVKSMTRSARYDAQMGQPIVRWPASPRRESSEGGRVDDEDSFFWPSGARLRDIYDDKGCLGTGGRYG